jgi:hypothetical protein
MLSCESNQNVKILKQRGLLQPAIKVESIEHEGGKVTTQYRFYNVNIFFTLQWE